MTAGAAVLDVKATESQLSARARGYVAEVDALRAVAALSVVAFHAGFFNLGWAGVWLFFAISGFAITTSLLQSETKGNPPGIYLRNFYVRRTIRIWPLYYFYIFIALMSGVALGASKAEQMLPWALTFTMNVRMMFLENPAFQHWLPFSVLWSLAVEEQFYLLWPFVFLLTARRFLPHAIIILCMEAVAVRIAIGAIGPSQGWSDDKTARVIYTFAFAHLDSFGLGAAIALARTHLVERPQLAYIALATAAGAFLLYATWFVAQDLSKPDISVKALPWHLFRIFAFGDGREYALYSVIALGSAAILALVVARDRIVHAFCRIPGLQSLGRVSFGIYLYHALSMEIVNALAPGALGPPEQRGLAQQLLCFVATLVLTIPVSYFSFRWIEQPFMRWRHQFG